MSTKDALIRAGVKLLEYLLLLSLIPVIDDAVNDIKISVNGLEDEQIQPQSGGYSCVTLVANEPFHAAP